MGLIQKVLQQRVAVFAHDGFGVKLHAFDIEGVVTHAHDFTTVRIATCPSGDAQTIGQAVALNPHTSCVLELKNFSRIHDVVGVKNFFDPAHDLNFRGGTGVSEE